jgi:hypothetical protein
MRAEREPTPFSIRSWQRKVIYFGIQNTWFRCLRFAYSIKSIWVTKKKLTQKEQKHTNALKAVKRLYTQNNMYISEKKISEENRNIIKSTASVFNLTNAYIINGYTFEDHFYMCWSVEGNEVRVQNTENSIATHTSEMICPSMWSVWSLLHLNSTSLSKERHSSGWSNHVLMAARSVWSWTDCNIYCKPFMEKKKRSRWNLKTVKIMFPTCIPPHQT